MVTTITCGAPVAACVVTTNVSANSVSESEMETRGGGPGSGYGPRNVNYNAERPLEIDVAASHKQQWVPDVRTHCSNQLKRFAGAGVGGRFAGAEGLGTTWRRAR